MSPEMIVMKNRVFSMFFAVFLCLFTLTVPAFATETTGGGTFQEGGYYGYIPSADETLGIDGNTVTTDDVNEWVDRKGSDVLSIVTRVVQITCAIGFFLCIGLTIVGAVGNKKTMAGGIVGLFICGLCFTAATCGTQILQAFSSWLMS